MNKKVFGTFILVLLAAAAFIAFGITPLTKVFAAAPQYTPQTRNMTVTALPLAVHEMQDTLGYLKDDFASGGLLDGKEVYGFYPSTITVFKGDTVNLSLVNPADDPHTFTVSWMGVDSVMKGKTVTKVSFTAKQAGIFTFYCNEAEHAPYMWGQLVVLPASAAIGE
jgi:plastocyanin